MNPCWINPVGYSLHPNLDETIKQGKQVYEAFIDTAAPLTFFDGKRKLCLKGRFSTDLGSVPRILHAIPGLGKDDWIRAYLFHDKICKDGGAWSGDTFIVFTREEADALLYQMVKVESELVHQEIVGKIASPVIWVGVRIGAFFGVGVQTKRYTIRHDRKGWNSKKNLVR